MRVDNLPGLLVPLAGLIIGILMLFLLPGCAIIDTYGYYPKVPTKPSKAWVLHQLEQMRWSHVANRGDYNSEGFDDYMVEVYDAVIKWAEEQ